MIPFLKDLLATFGRHTRGLLLFVGVIAIILILTASFLKYETTKASFCDSCHFMEPYIRHWEASSHSEVECVECHDYGVMALTGSALRYITGTHDNRPKANVLDESCLASDCHDVESLSDKKEYALGIQFDHSAHTEQRLRGEKLRCTSCHNRIVQTVEETQVHMTVNNKACFICHFKDAGVGEAITGCNSCHGMPEREVEHAGFMFKHEPYLRLEVECKQCHINIVRGD
ncbi:MAG: NapC/NirT family cytochrome c, partial [bacterium]|nr:NapC/NirT family cytochrome c [bacterium]